LTPRGVSAILFYVPRLHPVASEHTLLSNSFEPITKTTWAGDGDLRLRQGGQTCNCIEKENEQCLKLCNQRKSGDTQRPRRITQELTRTHFATFPRVIPPNE
jgi:hypothetical protein